LFDYEQQLDTYKIELSNYRRRLEKYEKAQKGILSDYSGSTDFNGKLPKLISTFEYKGQLTIWQNESYNDLVKEFIKEESQNKHGVKFWILKDKLTKEITSKIKKPELPIEPKKEDFDIKEYTTQAKINTKVAALKEGFRKYPRSLIRSEVINNKMFNDAMYQRKSNLNKNNVYNQKSNLSPLIQTALKQQGELTDGRATLHTDTKPNRDNLHNKVITLNKSIQSVKFFISKSYGEGKRGSKQYIKIDSISLNEEQEILNKLGLLKVTNGKLEERRLSGKNIDIEKYKIQLIEFNNKLTKHKVTVKKDDFGAAHFEVILNDKYIDDLIAYSKNYKLDNELDYSKKFQFNSLFKNMVNKLGLDRTNIILSYNNINLLTKEQVEQFLDKIDNENPSSEFDSRQNTDFAIDYTEENEENEVKETINTIIEDMLDDSGAINLDIDIKEIPTSEKRYIKTIYSEFQTKLNERYNIYLNLLKKLPKGEEKRKLILDMRRLKQASIKIKKEDSNIWNILTYIENDILILNDKLKSNNITNKELQYYYDVLNLWGSVITDWNTDDGTNLNDYIRANLEFQRAIITYQGTINKLKDELLNLDKQIAISESNKYMNSVLEHNNLIHLKEITKGTEEALDLSRTGNKLADYIFKLMNKAENVKTIRFNLFAEGLKEQLSKLEGKYDLSNKDVQRLLFEEMDDVLTGNLISRNTGKFQVQMKELESMRNKLSNSKYLSKQSRLISKKEDEILNFIYLDEYINEDNMLVKSKLDELKQKIAAKYDSDYADKLINDIINKQELFIQDAISMKSWIRDKISTEKKYEYVRKIYSDDNVGDNMKRIEMEVNSIYKQWYAKNNPYDYKNRKKHSKNLNGNAHKYLTFIPKEKFHSNKFKDLQKETELYEFYKYVKTNLDEYKSYLPLNVQERLLENFLPIIFQDHIKLTNKLKSSFSDIIDSINENTTVTLSQSITKLDITGKEILNIPIRYIKNSAIELKLYSNKLTEIINDGKLNPKELEEYVNKRDKLNKQILELESKMNTDIVFLLKSFALMAENYRAYNVIENDVKSAQRIIKNIKSITPTKRMEQINAKNGQVNIQEGAKNLMSSIDYSIKAMMYQQKKEHAQLGKKVIFKDKELQSKYDNIQKKIKLNNQKYILGIKDGNKEKSLTYFQYSMNNKQLEQEIQKLFDEEQPKIRTFDTYADTLTHITGMVNLGWNIKSAINNYAFGKLSLNMHAIGEEDFTRDHLKQAYKLLNKAELTGQNSQLVTKIKYLSDKYNVVFEVNEAAYGAKSIQETTESRFKDMFKSFGMTRRGEYYLQNAAMIAMMLNINIKVKDKITNQISEINLWDAYNSMGKFRDDVLYINEDGSETDIPIDYDSNIEVNEKSNSYYKLLEHIQQLNKMIHGNYDPRSPIKGKAKWYGRMAFQYKTWVPEGAAYRFETEKWDDMLGRDRKGKYKTALEIGLFKSFKLIFKSFFNKKNIDSIEFAKNVDRANMLKNLQEVRYLGYMLLANGIMRLTTMILTANGDDDDYKIKILRTLINQLSRLTGDLRFYMNLEGMYDLIGNGLPSAKYVLDWLNWIKDATKLATSDTYTMEDWLWSGAKQVPGFNELRKWYNEMEKLNSDYN